MEEQRAGFHIGLYCLFLPAAAQVFQLIQQVFLQTLTDLIDNTVMEPGRKQAIEVILEKTPDKEIPVWTVRHIIG